MPYTALGGSTGTINVGSVSLGLFPQALHPNVMAYVNAQVANGYSPSRVRVDALNNLTWGLVGEGLWDLCDVIYPFLGGTTSNAQKWNLKNVADTNAAYRINWVGAGFTFSDNGVQSSGAAGVYGDTFYTPGAPPAPTTTSNISICTYANIAGTGTGVYFGATTAGNAGATQIVRVSTVIGGCASLANSSYMNGGANFTGMLHAVRTGATTSVFYRNGLSIATSNGAVSTPNSNAYILNRGGSASPSNARLAFASIGQGMTAQQALDFYTLVQAYQTALARQV